MPSLTRYCGNKNRYIDHYRNPPEGTKRIVEPYLGSGAYLLNHVTKDMPGYGIELNKDLAELWSWLKTCSEQDLLNFNKWYESIKHTTASVKDLPDLNKGQQTYLRLNVCSVVLGQLSSWKITPKYNLPIKKTIECLPKLQHITTIQADAKSYVEQEGDLIFLDPPYAGTTGNYKEGGKANIEVNFRPQQTTDLIKKLTRPIIMTYGTDAPQTFPDFKWEKVAIRKVPNIRKGGTTDRVEYVSYINW